VAAEKLKFRIFPPLLGNFLKADTQNAMASGDFRHSADAQKTTMGGKEPSLSG
jgi:hypothetical protein